MIEKVQMKSNKEKFLELVSKEKTFTVERAIARLKSKEDILFKGRFKIVELIVKDSNHSEFLFKVYDFRSEIQRLLKIGHNWDGFGGIPLTNECSKRAQYIFSTLIGIDSETLDKIDYFLNPNGTFTFIWNNTSKDCVNIECGEETFSYFVEMKEGGNVFKNKIKYSLSNITKVSEYILKL